MNVPNDPLKPYIETTDHISPGGISRSTVYVMPSENVRKMDFAALNTSAEGWCTFQTRFQLAPSFNETDLTEIAIVVGGQEIRFEMRK